MEKFELLPIFSGIIGMDIEEILCICIECMVENKKKSQKVFLANTWSFLLSDSLANSGDS